MIRTLEFVPDDFDPEFYMDSYGEDYRDDFQQMFWEDVAYQLDHAQEVATDAARSLSDEVGLPPAFHDITVRREDPYPYGAYCVKRHCAHAAAAGRHNCRFFPHWQLNQSVHH